MEVMEHRDSWGRKLGNRTANGEPRARSSKRKKRRWCWVEMVRKRTERWTEHWQRKNGWHWIHRRIHGVRRKRKKLLAWKIRCRPCMLRPTRPTRYGTPKPVLLCVFFSASDVHSWLLLSSSFRNIWLDKAEVFHVSLPRRRWTFIRFPRRALKLLLATARPTIRTPVLLGTVRYGEVEAISTVERINGHPLAQQRASSAVGQSRGRKTGRGPLERTTIPIRSHRR
jgi:hypothetical protein